MYRNNKKVGRTTISHRRMKATSKTNAIRKEQKDHNDYVRKLKNTGFNDVKFKAVRAVKLKR